MKVVAPYTEFRTAGLFRSTAVSTGLALNVSWSVRVIYTREILRFLKKLILVFLLIFLLFRNDAPYAALRVRHIAIAAGNKVDMTMENGLTS